MVKEIAAFVQNPNEFLSIWTIAHEWEGLDPVQTDPNALPTTIKWRINNVILGYYKGDLNLRDDEGFRSIRHWLARVLFLDNTVDKLWKNLTKTKVNVKLLDSLYVKRGEVLHWCLREFTDPPPCWALPSTTQLPTQTLDDGDEDMRWYKEMSELRRRKTACLELAQHIWKHEGPIAYEAVRTHLLMKQVGLLNVFTPGGFKKAARDFAPEKVKLGGRPRETSI